MAHAWLLPQDCIAQTMAKDDGAVVMLPRDEHGMPIRREATILCCICGTKIPPNPANMCVSCLRSQVDITEGIPRALNIHQCRQCHRWQRPPFQHAELESPELLSILLKKIPGLSRSHGARLIDAGFIWTEPHSKRLKVKLTLEKDTEFRVRLRQSMVVEFTITNQQCLDCQRSFTEHTWRAVAQVRQEVSHKKTFFFLEQLILRHNAHTDASTVSTVPMGLDFFFSDKSRCAKFVDFLGSCVPIRYRNAKKLVSADLKSMTYNYKHTYAVEIAPICKDDLVVLPAKTASVLGSISPLCLVYRVSNFIFLVDPTTLQTAELAAERYWREPFRAQLTSEILTKFMVLDVTATPVEATGEAAAVYAHVTAHTKKSHGRKGRKGGRRGRKARRAAEEDDGEDDGDEVGIFEDASTVTGGPGMSTGGRRRRGKGGASLASGGIGGAMNPAGRRKALADDDDAGSMVTSAKDTARSVGVGQGGMGGVTMGRRLFGSGSSVTTSVTGGPKGKFLLADVELIRMKDVGESDTRITVRTHLGNVLKPGDTVLGYDVANSGFVRDAIERGTGVEGTGDGATETSTRRKGSRKGGRAGAGSRTKGFKGDIPEVVIVRKVYPERKGKRARGWKLKKLAVTTDGEAAAGSRAAAEAERDERDYESFLDELEQDRAMRKQIRLYRAAKPVGPAAAAAAKARAAAEAAAAAAAAETGAGADAAAASGAGDDAEDIAAKAAAEVAELEALVASTMDKESTDTAAEAGLDDEDGAYDRRGASAFGVLDEELLDEDEEEAEHAARIAREKAEALAADVGTDDAEGGDDGEWRTGGGMLSADMDTVRETAGEEDDDGDEEDDGEEDDGEEDDAEEAAALADE